MHSNILCASCNFFEGSFCVWYFCMYFVLLSILTGSYLIQTCCITFCTLHWLVYFVYLNHSLQALIHSTLPALRNAANKLIYKTNFHIQPVQITNSKLHYLIESDLLKCLTFVGFVFDITNYILYIFINPFHNGDLRDVSYNHTMKSYEEVKLLSMQAFKL